MIKILEKKDNSNNDIDKANKKLIDTFSLKGEDILNAIKVSEKLIGGKSGELSFAGVVKSLREVKNEYSTK
jgi:hypothetical protein